MLASTDPPVRTTGIRVASSSNSSVAGAVAELKDSFGNEAYSQIIVFFSKIYDAEQLAAELSSTFPKIPVSGCSTAGEIAPEGLRQSGIVALAFPTSGFSISSIAIDCMEIESVTALTRSLLKLAGVPENPGANSGHFAILLTDGISNREEHLLAAITWALDSIPLVGGSAGDDQAFISTDLIHNGKAQKHGAVLMLCCTEFDFRTFRSQGIEPTSAKLVVTRADLENRIVYELNAEPAATAYAKAIGRPEKSLGPLNFASYPLAVRVGGHYFSRSIRRINPDGSLSFFCAIDEGLVFTAAYPSDIIKATSADLQRIESELGNVDIILGFDCLFRRLGAESSQLNRKLESLYQEHKVVGFNTYGEQFNGLHLNETLTGIAFGSQRIRTNCSSVRPSPAESD